MKLICQLESTLMLWATKNKPEDFKCFVIRYPLFVMQHMLECFATWKRQRVELAFFALRWFLLILVGLVCTSNTCFPATTSSWHLTYLRTTSQSHPTYYWWPRPQNGFQTQMWDRPLVSSSQLRGIWCQVMTTNTHWCLTSTFSRVHLTPVWFLSVLKSDRFLYANKKQLLCDTKALTNKYHLQLFV